MDETQYKMPDPWKTSAPGQAFFSCYSLGSELRAVLLRKKVIHIFPFCSFLTKPGFYTIVKPAVSYCRSDFYPRHFGIYIPFNRRCCIMYSMKEACVQTGMSYETLKFYCKEGLVPNVKRDSHNYRVFDDRNIKWIQSLSCLKRCGMTLAEMKEYLAYCLEGPSSIPERKEILAAKKEALLASMEELQKAIDYIDWKQSFYDDVQSGKIEYHSNLISDEEIAKSAQ